MHKPEASNKLSIALRACVLSGYLQKLPLFYSKPEARFFPLHGEKL
jgi:hypothetical protein